MTLSKIDLKFHFRKNSLDEYIFKENFNSSQYIKFVNSLNSGDVVFDIGAHIGFFSMRISSSVYRVLAFEPEPENFSLLKTHINTNEIKNVDCVNTAVIGDDRKTMKFFINEKKNTGAHSAFVKRGRTEINVDCLRFSDMCNKVGANKIKIDTEGAELEILRDLKNCKNQIDEIILEFHPTILCRKSLDAYDECIKILKTRFSKVSEPPISRESLQKRWGVIIHAKN